MPWNRACPDARAGLLQWILIAGNLRVPCTLGRSGRVWRKREGDGGTPRGSWGMRYALVRPGRRIQSLLPQKPIRRDDAWCDEATDPNYNRPVRLPYRSSHERLWRDDQLYDVVVVLDYNDRQRRRFGGSAIFFHVSDPKGAPTAGCVAVSLNDMRKVLALCGQRTKIKVW